MKIKTETEIGKFIIETNNLPPYLQVYLNDNYCSISPTKIHAYKNGSNICIFCDGDEDEKE